MRTKVILKRLLLLIILVALITFFGSIWNFCTAGYQLDDMFYSQSRCVKIDSISFSEISIVDAVCLKYFCLRVRERSINISLNNVSSNSKYISGLLKCYGNTFPIEFYGFVKDKDTIRFGIATNGDNGIFDINIYDEECPRLLADFFVACQEKIDEQRTLE